MRKKFSTSVCEQARGHNCRVHKEVEELEHGQKRARASRWATVDVRF